MQNKTCCRPWKNHQFLFCVTIPNWYISKQDSVHNGAEESLVTNFLFEASFIVLVHDFSVQMKAYLQSARFLFVAK